MKFMPLIFVFSLLFLTACQESSSKKSSSSTNNNQYTCPAGYISTYQGCVPGTTSGGTTGSNCYASEYAFKCIQGCPGYVANSAFCNGSTTGTTAGGTTGSTPNPYPEYPSSAIYMNWGQQYPGGEPADLNCPAAVAPTGVSFPAYETRKATMSVQGGTFYNPASGIPYANTSSILKTVTNARTLFETDSVLKLRLKVKPQPVNDRNSHHCYIPNYTVASSQAGYYYLNFSVSIVGTTANGTIEEEFLGNYTKRINECTPVIDLNYHASRYSGGMYLKIHDVKDNTQVFPNNYAQYGFRDGTAYRTVRSMDCWVMDVEVAADGTKVFPSN